MRLSALTLVALLSAVTFAGCIDEPGTSTDEPTSDPLLSTGHTNGTWPTGQAARDYVESYVMTHPYRLNSDATQSFMDAARDDLQGLLEGFGVTVERHEYETGINILGIQPGTSNPEQWIVISAHYDTTESTVYGAWDDGAGTAALIALAEAYATWEFPFTVVYAFFDEEEQGLVGSGAFVRDYNVRDDIELVANINMDPPGLNWPCGDVQGAFPVKIIHNEAKVAENTTVRYPWLKEALDVGLATAQVPDEVRDYTPGIPIATAGGIGLSGTSDHAQFDAADIANVFLGGTPTSSAGPAAALTYGLHTPVDTLEQMEARCTGGDGTLADGLHTIVTTVTGTLVHMSETSVPML